MKKLLIIASILLVLGGIIFAIVMIGNKKAELIINTYDFNGEKVEKIELDTSVSDIVFIETTDGSQKVVCEGSQYFNHQVTIEDGTLKISSQENKKWYEYAFSFDLTSPHNLLISSRVASSLVNK